MRHWTFRLSLLLLTFVLLVALSIWGLLRGSLPQLDGEIVLPGLSAPVSIQRDALGVVTIDASNQLDAARTLGYVHAQERYFEMDLARRFSAGEMAALLGPAALETDRRHRVHRMRARIQAGWSQLDEQHQRRLEAYTEGVNAGLDALRVRPWPYLLLRQSPKTWTSGDSLLVGYSMYFNLQDSQNQRELALWQLRPHLPAALYALLTHDGSRWDAPMQGAPRGDARLPSAQEVDLRHLPTGVASRHTAMEMVSSDNLPGSNNFAVSGAVTDDGRAIVADDMHLGLRAPNIWFRARLRYPDPDAPGGQVDVQGFTLPGLPSVTVGSNGHVAWGFTNSYLDSADWRVESPCQQESLHASHLPERAHASEIMCTPLRVHSERIDVTGGPPDILDIRESDWGPVLHTLDDGRVLSLRWLAHLPGALNLGLAEFARAHNLEHAFALADRSATPTQNLLIADRSGQVAWRLLGPIPARAPGCPQGPAAVVEADMDCPPWSLDTSGSPQFGSPELPRLWTANARVVDGQALVLLGDGGYALGARAQQIRDNLMRRERFSEADLLAIQLDDHNAVLDEWWELLRSQTHADATPAMAALTAAIPVWEGRASVASVGYRIVRDWRRAVHTRLLTGLLAPAQEALGEAFVVPYLKKFEGVAWPLVSERPAHLLPSAYPDWQALFEDAAAEVQSNLQAQGPLNERTWGEHNTANICHPLAATLPRFTRRWLCMPPDLLPGDEMMARVQSPTSGASERMVVSPGREADGIIHMPGGQSGHLLSPFWGAGHADWVEGRAAPFLPGPERHTLTAHP